MTSLPIDRPASSSRNGDAHPDLLLVHHFGPHPNGVGGMASVIRVLTEHRVGCDSAKCHPTWRPDSRVAGIPLATLGALSMLRTGKPGIVHIHLAERGSFLREGALVRLARRLHRTTVVTLHGASFTTFAKRRPRLVASVLGDAHCVTCLDRDAFDLVRELVPDTMVTLLPNPVAMDDGSPSAKNTDEIVVFAGEISLRKGADVLCRAWEQVAMSRPAARCIMVGPPTGFVVPSMERLEIRPPIDAHAMRRLIRTARVVTLPSRAEGMPMVLTEAMSGGRPFVSTPVGGIPELADGGVLVSVGDFDGLAKCLIDFLADSQYAASIGERGRRFCSATRSVDVVDMRLRNLYIEATRLRCRLDSR